MRTITKITTVYKFKELSERAQEQAIQKLYDINVDHDWSESVLEEAKDMGLKIESFDLDRNRNAKGKVLTSEREIADEILKNFGKDCDIYKCADAFLTRRDKIINDAPKDASGEVLDVEKLDAELDECEEEFRANLLEEYALLLQKEYEYQTSREAIIETIEANDYEFTEEGKLA